MASTKAIYASLKMLSHNFAGDISRERVELWEAALREVSDEQLSRAVPTVIATYTGSFLPPVAVIREAAGANRLPVLDFDDAKKRIADLGHYNAHTGWIYPRVFEVREKLGDMLADAYSYAGADQIFSDNETTRSIAQRTFRERLSSDAEKLGLLALPARPLQLTDPAIERAKASIRKPQPKQLKGASPLADTISQEIERVRAAQ